MNYNGLTLLSGSAHPELSQRIAAMLDSPLCSAQVGRFPDGEIDVKVHEDIRGRDVFVLQPTCPPVNENIMELLTLVDACKRSSVGRILQRYFGGVRYPRLAHVCVRTGLELIRSLLDLGVLVGMVVHMEWTIVSVLKDAAGGVAGVLAYERELGRFRVF